MGHSWNFKSIVGNLFLSSIQAFHIFLFLIYSFAMKNYFLSFLILTLLPNPLFAQDKTYESLGQKFKIENLSSQEDSIWGFDFIDSTTLIFTERGGKLKLLDLQTKKITDLSGTPAVWAKGQGGLLDVRVHPRNPNEIFLTYSKPTAKDEAATAFAKARLDGKSLVELKEILAINSPSDEKIHFGSRIEFDGKGHVYVTVGDRNDRDKVQDLKFHNGKLLRFALDGTIPKDNPYVTEGKALPEIFSYGHRSPQGLAKDSQGNIWLVEMGPRGGDELNLIQAKGNYGWPNVTYGKEYYGLPIGVKEKAGTVQPVAYWVPSISPSGVAFYEGSVFPKWKGHLFIGCLSGTQIRRLEIKDNKVVNQEALLDKLGYRFRIIRTGPDGFLYFSTDAGLIARIIAL